MLLPVKARTVLSACLRFRRTIGPLLPGKHWTHQPSIPSSSTPKIMMPTAPTTAVVDGSRGEGGGQILRNAIAYATILQRGVRIYGVRAGRVNPGLRAQHLTGIRLAVDAMADDEKGTNGRLEGDALHSTEIRYQPPAATDDDDANDRAAVERTITGDTGTAGSIVLLLQAALPGALFGRKNKAPCRLRLRGGTNATMAPQYDYWERVFWPTVREQCGLEADQIQARVLRRGFFPKGGGEVEVRIKPLNKLPLQPIRLTNRGDVASIYIRSFHAGNLPRHLAEQMAKVAKSTLRQRYPNVPLETEIVTERQAVGSGLGILVMATTTTGCRLAGSALSSPQKKARDVAAEAARELLQTLDDGGCVDEWLQDQLILFMALAGGVSEMVAGSLTLHTQTAIWIAQELSGAAFEVTRVVDHQQQAKTTPGMPSSAVANSPEYGKDGRIAGKHLIRCHGIGFHK